MRGIRFRHFVSAFAVIGTSACTLMLGSGYSEGDEPWADGSEAGAWRDGPEPDRTDDPVLEAGVGVDAPAADAQASPCQSPHLFCADFEQGDVGEGFTSQSAGGGTLTLDSTKAHSGQRSALFATDSSHSGGSGPSLSVNLSAAAKKIIASFALSLEDDVGVETIRQVLLDTITPSGRRSFRLQASTSSPAVLSVEHLFADASYQHEYVQLPGLLTPPGVWAKVRLELVTTDSPSISVFADDQLVAKHALHISAVPSSVTLTIGFVNKSWKAGKGSSKVRFDDVVIDAEP